MRQFFGREIEMPGRDDLFDALEFLGWVSVCFAALFAWTLFAIVSIEVLATNGGEIPNATVEVLAWMFGLPPIAFIGYASVYFFSLLYDPSIHRRENLLIIAGVYTVSYLVDLQFGIGVLSGT